MWFPKKLFFLHYFIMRKKKVGAIFGHKIYLYAQIMFFQSLRKPQANSGEMAKMSFSWKSLFFLVQLSSCIKSNIYKQKLDSTLIEGYWNLSPTLTIREIITNKMEHSASALKTLLKRFLLGSSILFPSEYRGMTTLLSKSKS